MDGPMITHSYSPQSLAALHYNQAAIYTLITALTAPSSLLNGEAHAQPTQSPARLITAKPGPEAPMGSPQPVK
jgi:hypothetical protein